MVPKNFFNSGIRLFGYTAAAFLFGNIQFAKGQLSVEYGGSPEALSQLISGDGVQILNPQITCADGAFGTYTSFSINNFPSAEGLILSTGDIGDAPGPNLSQATTTEWTTPGNSLIDFISGTTSYDACVFEFDVVPVGDTLRFNFTFASEEYREYVGTPFNDAFGFFISGPGITGTPGLNGSENIALIPGTNVPVGINTVNNGNPSIGFPAINAQYFHLNALSFNAKIGYDGWTKGLFAERAVTPCDTFHLKLVIADVGDRKFDSSVFIEAIESNNIRLSSITAGGIDNMVEGCNEGTVIFSRTPVTNQPVVVTYFIGGTAINGVDYPLIGSNPDPTVPKTIVIPANVESVSISIMPFPDGLDEGDEYIAFYVGNPFCSGTVQDSLIFTISDSLKIAVLPPLSYVCLGDSITFNVEGDGSSFLWNPATYLDDVTSQEPTSIPTQNIVYSVSTFASTCVSTTTVEVQVTDLQLVTNVTNVLCAGLNTGVINLTMIGGQSPFTFEWTGPNEFTASTQNATGLASGIYNVMVTDRDGCTASTSATILELPAVIVSASSPVYSGGTNISCHGAEDGQATAIPGGGTAPYTYIWDDPSVQTTQTATGLAAGTYTVAVSDANGCQAQALVNLSEPDAIVGSLVERVDILCFGNNTGSITVGASGGNPPYTYAWNTNPVQTGTSINNLLAGLYVITITDLNGCNGFTEVEISQPESPVSVSLDIQNTSCFGGSDGSATATVSGGTAPYTFAWSGGVSGTGLSIQGLPAGPYMFTATDANDCEISIPFNVSNASPITFDAVSITDIACFGEWSGSVTVIVSGGTGNLSYSWNTIPPTTTQNLQNVPAGSYTLTATDESGCSEILEITISQPENPLTIQTIDFLEPTCNNGENGSITISGMGGTAPYQYIWHTTPPSSNPALSDLPAGSYGLTIIDANGCEADTLYVLNAPDELEITVTNLIDVLCHGASTGLVATSVSGGTPPYNYSWNDPLSQSSASANNLAAGTYTLSVTDNNNCLATLTVIINEPAEPLGGIIAQITNVLCFGDNSGMATVIGTGGSGSYSYAWNDPLNQQTSTASGLADGEYTVVISDLNGCTETVEINVTITGPDAALVLNLTPSIFPGGNNVACADDSTATLNVAISGGTLPYSILWNLPGLDTSTDENLSDLAPGIYAVTVTDGNGCTENVSITLTAPNPIAISAITTPSECFGIPSGSIDLSISGGVADYNVEWNGPNGFTSSLLSMVDLEGGIYNLSITDASGCVYIDVVTVIQPEDLVITVDSLSNYNGFNTRCWNSQDGKIYITPSGGILPYSYQWNRPNNPNFSNQQDVTNVPAGFIEVVLIDGNNCIQNEIIELVAPAPLEVDFDVSLFPNGFNTSCAGAADGSIEALPSGGNPGYTFLWIGPDGFGPAFINPIEDLVAGEYSVLIRDANNCMYSESIEITAPDPFSILLFAETYNGSNISCNGGDNGSINLIVSGNGAPYEYVWTGPNGYTSNSEDPIGVEAGEYCVTVTDVNGCNQSGCIVLSEPAPVNVLIEPVVYSNGLNLTCSNAQDGGIAITLSGGIGNYNISWTGPGNFTSNQTNLTQLSAGTYCVNVQDANGCVFSECVELIAPGPINIIFEGAQQILCAGDETASINSIVTGGQPNYFYSWTGPDGFTANTATIENLEVGQYCLTVTDANNCTQQSCIQLSTPLPLLATLQTSSFNGGFQIGCSGGNAGSILATPLGGSQPFTYSWSGPNGFSASSMAIQNLSAGTYCLEVTDANGCTYDICTTLTEPSALAINPAISVQDCSIGELAEVDLNVSGGIPPYSFNWSSGANSETVSLGDGIYTVIITDANGCSITESITIDIQQGIQLNLFSSVLDGGFNIGCFNGFTGAINATILGGQGNLTINWTGPNGFLSATEDLSELEAGQYCLEVTDELGCTAQSCISLTQPTPISLTTLTGSAGCNIGSDGQITVIPSGGVPTFTYQWTGPNGYSGFGPTNSQLIPGEYCITATDQNGCQATTCVEIIQSVPLDIVLSSPESNGFNVACFGDNTGNITSTISGGNAPYLYNWTGPMGFSSTLQNPSNLVAGEYCLTILDANFCSIATCIELFEAPGIEYNTNIAQFPNGYNISCNGVCDGALQVSLAGGAEPIALAWSGPDGFTSDLSNLSNLCAGNYTLVTTDANGCEQSSTYIITQPQPLIVNLDSPTFPGGTEISCFEDSNGVINASVTGGSPAFSFQWSGPNGFSSTAQNLSGLDIGTYSVNVTDLSGCSNSAQVTLEQPESPLSAEAVANIFASGENVSCFGGNDGSIASTVSGGIPPYNYNWLGPDGFSASTQNISELSAGTYTLVVLDVNTCSFTVNVNLVEPETAIEATTSISEINCPGENSGSVLVNVSGGNSDYTIDWTGPNAFTSTSFGIADLGAGDYTFTVTDLNGCALTEMITLENPTGITISGETAPASCVAATGSIILSVSGGAEPYTYLWNTGELSANISNLTSGSYLVIVTDDNGCEQTASFTVASENDLTVQVAMTPPLCHGSSDGSILASLISGQAPLIYTWTGPNNFSGSGDQLSNLIAGEYGLSAVDQNGCLFTETYTLTQPNPLTIDNLGRPLYPNGFNIGTYGGEDGIILQPEIDGGTPSYTFTWTGPNGFVETGSGARSGLITGTYTLVVRDSKGCTDTAFITLLEPIPIELPNGISPNGDGFNDNLQVRGLENFPSNSLQIYNRWGNLVHEEQNYSNMTPWYGLNKSGEELPEGTYFVIVEIPGRDNLRGYLELRR